ncbi:HNH endonuclease [Nostoc sphaeroides CHAB 2801]|uniref:HNH endonuclease n=1 Tax=Nostoc sphaeroides TaxID=446679 RepID=UPI001E3D66B2|nr:HNH endonuclease [Nostoc sphaeroides]MCC5634116.1 HNH endonuclease [Nostoc sphaeroides CHAB 2801]
MLEQLKTTNIDLGCEWKCIYTFLEKPPIHYIPSVRITPDEKKVVSSSLNKILLHDLNTGEICNTFLGHSDQVISFDISYHNNILASGGRDKTVKLWDLNGGKIIKSLSLRSDEIYCVTFSPDGKIIAAGGSNKYRNKCLEQKTTTIYLWNTYNGELLGTLCDHTLRVTQILFSPDNRILVSQSNDFTIKVWDIQTHQLLYTILEDSYVINDIAITPDGKNIIGIGIKGLIIWDLFTGAVVKVSTNLSCASSLKISPDMQIIVTMNPGIKVWNFRTNELISWFGVYYPNTNNYACMSAIEFSPSGNLLAGCVSLSEGGLIKVWEVPYLEKDILEKQFNSIKIPLIKTIVENQKEEFAIDSIQDTRQRIGIDITRRQGQKDFRDKLLIAYNRRCAVTDCDVEQALEAAHIFPYKGNETNKICNGLILRSDIHTLFDLYLLTINAETYKVSLAPELKHTSYSELDGKKISLPKDIKLHPHKEALDWHNNQCKWIND